MSGGNSDKHALRRTSPKGEGMKFFGICSKCGMKNLPAEAVTWPCSNPANMSQDEALILAIKDKGIGA